MVMAWSGDPTSVESPRTGIHEFDPSPRRVTADLGGRGTRVPSGRLDLSGIPEEACSVAFVASVDVRSVADFHSKTE